MPPNRPGLSRRTLLSVGAGGLGLVGIGTAGARLLARDPVEYDRRMQVTDTGIDLVVDWKEWYNGEPTGDTQDTPQDTDDRPVVTLENVLPGDTGKLAFGLGLRSETGAQSAQLEMRVRAFDERENGLTEPERVAGDTSSDDAELAEAIRLFGWYDTGIAAGDTPIYGHCDGAFDGAVDEVLFDDSLAAVADAEWRRLDANPNADDDCLDGDEALCVGLEWELPGDSGAGSNANVIQSDSVTFEIAFGAFECEQ